MATATHRPRVAAVQQRYARLLEWGVKLGLAALVLSLGTYLLELLPWHVPLHQVADAWTLPRADYLNRTTTPVCWG